MKLLVLYYLLIALPVWAELPTSGFRAVSGGSSPDGRWIVCVLGSSGAEFMDQLPASHHSPYLVDLNKMRAVNKFAGVTTLGGYNGRPESNVTAKWFPDSTHVSIGWRVGRLNYDFAVFKVSRVGGLSKIHLPDPLKIKESIFANLKAHSNCGNYLESITSDGALVVVYYGFWPKNDTFYKTAQGKTVDHNRIEVVFKKVEDKWIVKSIASHETKGKK